jgi:hypothetical protein
MVFLLDAFMNVGFSLSFWCGFWYRLRKNSYGDLG